MSSRTERIKRLKAEAFTLMGNCAGCGAAPTEFHHVDPETKENGPVDFWCWGKARREAELAKCIPVCSDCHKWYHRPNAVCGTVKKYGQGCRCDACRGAASERSREWRARTNTPERLAAEAQRNRDRRAGIKRPRKPRPQPVCGTLSKYHNQGCRCDECKAAEATYQRKRKAKFRAEDKLRVPDSPKGGVENNSRGRLTSAQNVVDL